MMTETDALTAVEGLYDSVLADEGNRQEVEYLQKETNLTREQIIRAWIFWDTGIRGYANEVYSSDALRFTMHMHNMLPGNWHEKRQQKVSEYMRVIRPRSICEVGFGTPQRYVKESLQSGDADILLADYEGTSIRFAKKVLTYWNPAGAEKVKLKIFNMNRDPLPSEYEAYVFQDSLEHAEDPTAVLRSYVESARQKSHFIFSLPVEVENPIPEHFICWENGKAVVDWVAASGLNVLDSQEIAMNRELDIYASSLHPDFREIVILAQKS